MKVAFTHVEEESVDTCDRPRQSIVQLPERGRESVGDAVLTMAGYRSRLAHVQLFADRLGRLNFAAVLFKKASCLAVVEKLPNIDESRALCFPTSQQGGNVGGQDLMKEDIRLQMSQG